MNDRHGRPLFESTCPRCGFVGHYIAVDPMPTEPVVCVTCEVEEFDVLMRERFIPMKPMEWPEGFYQPAPFDERGRP